MKKGHAFNANVKFSQQSFSSNEDQVKDPIVKRQLTLKDEWYIYQKLWRRRNNTTHIHSFLIYVKKTSCLLL